MPSSERTTVTLNAAELLEARGWIADCQWIDTELMTASEARDVVDTLAERQVLRIVERNYDGGLEAFVIASGFRGDDALGFDEGANGENAAHELGECDPSDCPHCEG